MRPVAYITDIGQVAENTQVEADETTMTGEENRGPQYSLLSQCNIPSNLTNDSCTDKVAQLPSIREMALVVGPSPDRGMEIPLLCTDHADEIIDQSQVWNYRQNLTTNSGNNSNFITEQRQRPQLGNVYHLSQSYEAGNSAGNSSLPPSKERRGEQRL